MELKELRLEKGLTQKETAELLGISLRSYLMYEHDENRKDSFKYQYMLDRLHQINPIDEEHGILKVDDIANKVSKILVNYQVSYCYLFGSYAKGIPTESSDVDLLVCTQESGLNFFDMVEQLRNVLHKKVDVLDLNQLKDNFELTKEILKDGIKIYEQSEK